MARPSKPSALKLVQGTARASRMNGSEPEPELVSADIAETPPAHLSARSAAVWREVAPMLRSIQVLTVADLLALEVLCDQVADYRHARAQVGDDFVGHSPKTGAQMLNQWLVAAQMTAKHAEQLMSRFGMDPQSRARLMINPQGDLFGGDAKPAGTARFFGAK